LPRLRLRSQEKASRLDTPSLEVEFNKSRGGAVDPAPLFIAPGILGACIQNLIFSQNCGIITKKPSSQLTSPSLPAHSWPSSQDAACSSHGIDTMVYTRGSKWALSKWFKNFISVYRENFTKTNLFYVYRMAQQKKRKFLKFSLDKIYKLWYNLGSASAPERALPLWEKEEAHASPFSTLALALASALALR